MSRWRYLSDLRGGARFPYRHNNDNQKFGLSLVSQILIDQQFNFLFFTGTLGTWIENHGLSFAARHKQVEQN
jgi:hypothetical protein